MLEVEPGIEPIFPHACSSVLFRETLSFPGVESSQPYWKYQLLFSLYVRLELDIGEQALLFRLASRKERCSWGLIFSLSRRKTCKVPMLWLRESLFTPNFVVLWRTDWLWHVPSTALQYLSVYLAASELKDASLLYYSQACVSYREIQAQRRLPEGAFPRHWAGSMVVVHQMTCLVWRHSHCVIAHIRVSVLWLWNATCIFCSIFTWSNAWILVHQHSGKLEYFGKQEV